MRTLPVACLAVVVALGLVAALGGCGQKKVTVTPPVREPSTLTTPDASAPGPKFRIGFSQCTVKEPWRILFNELLEAEADKHKDTVELEIQDADDKTEQQVAQMETFINRKMDAILISPKEAPGLTDVVKRATDAGIPVIVLDRDVETDEYACFIGGDNMEIGREAGKFAVEHLGGEGAAKGTVYEICGGLVSTPAQERRDGFHEIVKKEPGITIVGGIDGDWKQDEAYKIMEAALKTEKDINLVYAHNDPMAYGARLAYEASGMSRQIDFIGIDAIPSEGCQWVKDGKLVATFVYPPPGEKGLQVALEILKGQEPESKRIMLETRRITKETVDEYLKEKGKL